MKKTEISRAALGRIPAYIQHLKSLPPSVINISATSIANGLGYGEVQVRKDLGALCGSGKPKTGYNRSSLEESLERYLQCGDGGTVIVGAGQLGRALLDYGGFEGFGISMLAAFDQKTVKVETSAKGKPILPMEALPAFCKNNEVRLGIIAVPPESAQEVCDSLYENGVKAMWSFAPCRLREPADAVVQYENLALSLSHLKLRINEL